jgi:hypothetical protein
LFIVPEAKRAFLDAGHYLQEAVEAFLMERLPATPFELLLDWRECEGNYEGVGWNVTGHVDGVLKAANKTGLLEVKAIKNNSFNKLKKAGNWKDVYGHYTYQAQTYLHFDSLMNDDKELFTGPFMGTHFIFYNRDTSEMLGSLPIDFPGYTERKDMYEPRDIDIWTGLVEKFTRAYTYIIDENVPESCDAEGYCYFCQQRGKGFQIRREKKVGLVMEDEEWRDIASHLSDITEAEGKISRFFQEFRADVIQLPTGTTLRKGDYE